MSLQACAEVVAKADPDRFRAVMTVPLTARERLLPLYAFNVEVARAPWVTEEPLIAEMRLQWWRDVLEEIAVDGPVRRHEVVDALSPVVRDRQVPMDALMCVIDARRWDIEREPFAELDAMKRYCADTGGGLMWAAAKALGSPDEAHARAIGQISGLANLLLAWAQLSRMGRQILEDPPEAAITDMARQAIDDLSSLRSRGDRALRYATRAAWRMGPVLRQAAIDPAAVVEDMYRPDFRARTDVGRVSVK